MEELLAVGASIIVRPCGADGFRFMTAKYAIAIELGDLRQGLIGDDLAEIFARGLEWVKDVQFYNGSQWTAEQAAILQARANMKMGHHPHQIGERHDD